MSDPKSAPPRLRLLGEIALSRDGEPLVLPASRKTRALLAFLATTAKQHRRERLCELFWNLPDDPRGSLRWSLSRLRPLLDDPGAPRLHADRDHVSIPAGTLFVDLHHVERLAADESAPAAQLMAAVDMFGGDFAEGLELPDSDDFQSWLAGQRGSARRIHMRLLGRLITVLPPDQALEYAQRRLAADPDRAEYHLDALRLLLMAGRRRDAEIQAELSYTRIRKLSETDADALLVQWRKILGEPPASRAGGLVDATPALRAEKPVEGGLTEERRHVTVLCAGIQGGSLMTDPEALAEDQAPAIAAMTSAAERFGGMVTQRRSDGITALFGVPRAFQDQTARACLAALALGDLPAGSQHVAAIHSGEVLVRSENDRVQVFGTAIKIAQWIERTVPGRSVHITGQAFRAVEGMFEGQPAGTVSIPGLDDPVELISLSRHQPLLSGWHARVRRGLTSFVGREHELSTLLRASERARTGNGQAAVLVGEAGLGKSRLLHEMEHIPGFEPGQWQRLECAATPYDKDTPYFLIGRLIRHWLGISRPLPDLEVRPLLQAGLASLDPALEVLEQPLGIPLNLAADADWLSLGMNARRRRLTEAVDALLLTIAVRKPLLLAIEDLHWADPDSRAIIDAVVNRIDHRPMLLVCTTRPEALPEWVARASCQLIRLAALEGTAASEMGEALLGTDQSVSRLVRRIVERTGGNPLFMEETVASLVDSGNLVGVRGRYRLSNGDEQQLLPASVRNVIAERLDNLPGPIKLLLQVAAVIGNTISIDVLRPLMELTADELYERLEVLQEEDLLFEAGGPSDRIFSFKHALIREVAYAGLTIASRKGLHRRVLKVLLSKFRKNRDDLIENMAIHAMHAERFALAAKFLRRSGDRSVLRSSYREAVRFYGAALEAAASLRPSGTVALFSIAIRLRLRPPLVVQMEVPALLSHMEISEDLAARRGNDRLLATVLIHKSYAFSVLGSIGPALQSARSALELSARTPGSLTATEATLALGQALAFQGNAVAVLDTLTPILSRLTGDLRHQRLGQAGIRSVFCLLHLSLAYSLLGDFTSARRMARDAAQIAAEARSPFDRAVIGMCEGFIDLEAGKAVDARDKFFRCRELAEQHDNLWIGLWTLTGFGHATVKSGDDEGGRRLLEAARKDASRLAVQRVEAFSTVYLSEAHHDAGRYEEAGKEAALALSQARRQGFWEIEVMALLCLGKTLLRTGDREKARACLIEAAALARERSYRPLAAESQLRLSEIGAL